MSSVDDRAEMERFRRVLSADHPVDAYAWPGLDPALDAAVRAAIRSGARVHLDGQHWSTPRAAPPQVIEVGSVGFEYDWPPDADAPLIATLTAVGFVLADARTGLWRRRRA